MATLLTAFRRARRSAPALVGGAAALILVASGCSQADGASDNGDPRPRAAGTAGDSGPPEPSTTIKVLAGLGTPLTALVNGAGLPGLGDSSTAGIEVSPEQQSCLEREASSLDGQDVRTITANGTFAELSLPGTNIVSDAITTCIPNEMLAQGISEEYVAKLGVGPREGEEPDPEIAMFTECIANGLSEDRGGLLMSVAAETAGQPTGILPEPVRAVVDPCANPLMSDKLINTLTNEGYDFDGAACITFGFLGRTNVSDFLDYGGLDGELPPILAIDLKELRENCGPPTGG